MSMTAIDFSDSKQFHRAPIGFGPAPGPRQDPTGRRFDWSQSECTTVGVTYRSEHEALDALLPEGYAVDFSKPAAILFEVMELRNLPWLNGRGYNTWGVYISNVICSRTSEEYRGSYMACLFESFTDPITTGREELGFPKVWAELPDAEIKGQTRVHTASWFGHEFMRLELPNLKVQDKAQAPALSKRDWTHPTQDGILHHRYVPTVGQPGRHDASYTTFCPAPPGSAPVKHYETVEATQFDQVKLDIVESSWEQLPTLWNIVKGLRAVPRLEILEVAVQTFAGASDLLSNQRVD